MLILFEMKKTAYSKLAGTPLKAASTRQKISFLAQGKRFLIDCAIKRSKTNIFGLLSDKLV